MFLAIATLPTVMRCFPSFMISYTIVVCAAEEFYNQAFPTNYFVSDFVLLSTHYTFFHNVSFSVNVFIGSVVHTKLILRSIFVIA